MAADQEGQDTEQVEQKGDHQAEIVAGSSGQIQSLGCRTGFWRRTGFGARRTHRCPHNPKVAGSNPAPATSKDKGLRTTTVAPWFFNPTCGSKSPQKTWAFVHRRSGNSRTIPGSAARRTSTRGTWGPPRGSCGKASPSGSTHVTGDGATIRTNYGTWPGYLALMVTDFDRANEKAFGIGLKYDFGGTLLPFRVLGLSVHLIHAQGNDREGPTTGWGPTTREGDLDVIYNVAAVKGLSLRFRNGYGDDGGVCGRAGRSSSRGCSRCRAARPSPGPRAPTVPSRESRGRPPVERIATPETRRQRQAHWRRFSGPLSRSGC